MGRNIRFWIAPGIKNDNVLTPTTLTVHTDAGVIAVIGVRPPLKGEQGWQCWPDLPLVEQVREMLTDWGGDPPGWTATRNEENGDHEGCFYITVLAAFDLDAGIPAVRHSLNPIKLHTQSPPAKYRYDWSGNDPRRNAAGMVPGDEARAANARDALAAKLAIELREDWKAAVAMPEGRDVAFWLNPIAAAMNRMEEIGGPHDADYLAVMEWVAKEAARRANVLSTAMSRARFKEGDCVEVTRDCEIGKVGERARVDRVDGKFIRLTFHMDGRSFSTGADYKHLRKVGSS